ncbi:MAG: hypothetical protein IRY85_10005 [Micromonosporaceae bacterium]|nr:hypothetical protein [Micromonosporaceae bacterium]
MTATATKPRQPKNKPAPPVPVATVSMPSYEDLVAELGIDPDAIYEQFDKLWASDWSLDEALALAIAVEGEPRGDLADHQPDPEPVVYDLDAADWDDAVTRGLQRLGLTYDELADQAQRGEFSSVEARKLWIAIGGTEPPAESTSLLGLLDDDLTTVIPTLTETPEETR